MTRLTTIALTILFTIFSPFAVMWCAYFLTAKVLNMHEVFNSEIFWAVTGFWWLIGGCVVLVCTIGPVNREISEEALKEEAESIERRVKYYEENMPKRKY